MKKNYARNTVISVFANRFLLVFLISFTAFCVNAQNIDGNYRTAATGNWNDIATWQVRTAGSWAAASTIPGSSDTVSIQLGHTVTLTQNENVAGIYINTNGGAANGGVIACGDFTLNIYGLLRGYTGAAVVSSSDAAYTASNTPAPGTVTCNANGRFKFVGNTRNLTIASNWGGSGLTTSAIVEFALSSGQTGTINTSFKANTIILSSGTVDMLTNRIAPDNNVADQGDLTIKSGAILTSAQTGATNTAVMSRTTNTSTGKGGTLTIESGGTLRLTGAAPRIGMTTVVNNGTIEYALTGAQTFLAGTGGMTNFTNYNKLILSGSGAKTTVGSTAITVSDTFRIAGSPATFALGTSSTLTYGASAVLEYAGTAAQTVAFTEWPSNGALSIPPTVVINNSSGVTVGTASPQPRRLIGSSGGSNGKLVLKSGLLQNSSNVRIYSPSTIVRIGGSLSALPDSLTNLTVNYQNTSPISTGPEFGVVNSQTLGTVTLGTVALVIDNSSTVTLSANRQVNGSISLTNGTLDISTFTLTSRGSLNRTNGIITATNGTMNFTNTPSSQTLQTAMFTNGTINNLTINAAGGVIIGSSITVSNSLTLTNGTLTSGGNLTLANNATINRTGGTIADAAPIFGTTVNLSYNNSVGLTTGLEVPTSTTTLNNFTISGQTVTLGSSTTINGNLTLTDGVLAIGSNTLTYAGSSITRTLGSIDASHASSTLIFTNTSSLSLPSNTFLGNVNNLTINATGGVVLGSALTVSNSLALTSGAFTTGGSLTLANDATIFRTSGTIADAAPIFGTKVNLSYNNSVGLTTGLEVPTTTSTLKNFTISGQTVTLGSSTTINGNLALTAGVLALGSNTLTYAGSSITRTSGSIDASDANSTLIFTNTSSLSLPANTFSGNVNNFTLNGAGGVTLGSATAIARTLTLTSGTLTTSDFLTLASDNSTTSRVAEITGGGITGNVTVQRFLPKRRAWRFLTAPVTQNTPQSLNATWQTQIDIVGPSGTNLSAIKNGYSFLTYNATTDAWTNVNNPAALNLTGTSLNNAFAAFIPGPSGTVFGDSADVTLSSIGALLTGNKSFTSSAASGNYILIPNPYASPVDLETIFTGSTGIDPLGTIYTWDPRLGGGSGTGGYISIQRTGVNTYNIVGGTTAQTQIIQSGQAFFVQANAASQSINFTEAAKSSTNINTVFGVGTGNTDKLRIGFNRYEGTNAVEISEVLSTFGNNYSKAVNLSEDAEKMWNNEENIALRRGNYNLSIESRPFIGGTNDSIFLALSSLRANTNYALEFKPSNWDAGSKAYLIDKLLSTETLIDLNAASFTHQFTSTVATANDRFVVVFRGATLPNKNFIVGAEKLGTSKVKVNWEAQGETGVKEYSLEKSVDGVNYQLVNTQVAKNGNSNSKYTFTDNSPVNGVNYYRVKTTQQNDIERYSSVVTVNFRQNNTTPLTVYPNPVRGNQIGLQLQELEQGIYSIRLISVDGREVYKQQLQVGSSRGLNTTISPQTKLSTGTYTLQVVGKNQSYTQKVVVE